MAHLRVLERHHLLQHHPVQPRINHRIRQSYGHLGHLLRQILTQAVSNNHLAANHQELRLQLQPRQPVLNRIHLHLGHGGLSVLRFPVLQALLPQIRRVDHLRCPVIKDHLYNHSLVDRCHHLRINQLVAHRLQLEDNPKYR